MLTKKQSEVLDFIRAYTLRNGISPTLREIGDELKIKHRGSVSKHVSALKNAGFIDRDANGWRSARINHDLTYDNSRYCLPLLGKIAAGKPIEAIEGRDEIDLIEYLLGPNRFLLEVEGDSMIDAGIMDGDLVVIKQQDTANNGEIAVALIDDHEATLKYFYRRSAGKVELMPDNPRLEPMMYDGHRVKIQGVLVAQLRRY